MAVVKCLHRHTEQTPAEFLVISADQEELRTIGQWVMERDLQAVISVSDSVDGINHSFTITMYDKEAIVLFMLIWS